MRAAISVPPVMHDPVEVAHRIFEAARGADKTVLCVLMARDDVIRALEPGAGLQACDEGPVERDRGDHLAASPSGADNGDLSRSRRLVALADAKAPGRLDGQPGVAPQHALECGAVARKKRPLEIKNSCAEVVTIVFGEDPKATEGGRRQLAGDSTVACGTSMEPAARASITIMIRR